MYAVVKTSAAGPAVWFCWDAEEAAVLLADMVRSSSWVHSEEDRSLSLWKMFMGGWVMADDHGCSVVCPS